MKRLTSILFAILITVGVVGCVTTSIQSAIEPNISQSEAEFIANDLSDFLATMLPPASTTLVLSAAPNDKVFVTAFAEDLRKRGYAVAEMNKKSEPSSRKSDGIRVRYEIGRFEAGVIVVLKYGNAEATRYYDLSTGSFRAAAAAVREGK